MPFALIKRYPGESEVYQVEKRLKLNGLWDELGKIGIKRAPICRNIAIALFQKYRLEQAIALMDRSKDHEKKVRGREKKGHYSTLHRIERLRRYTEVSTRKIISESDAGFLRRKRLTKEKLWYTSVTTYLYNILKEKTPEPYLVIFKIQAYFGLHAEKQLCTNCDRFHKESGACICKQISDCPRKKQGRDRVYRFLRRHLKET
jgi:hypothetical protein